MDTILCLLHTEADGSLSKAARETLSAAIDLSQQAGTSGFGVGLVGESTGPAADVIARCGAERFYGLNGAEFGVSRYGTDAAAAAAVIARAQATLVVAPGSLRWRRALPGVALRLGGRIDTQVTGLAVADGSVSIERWYYRQRMVASLSRSQRPWLVLLAGGVAAPWQGDRGKAEVEAVAVEPPAGALGTRVIGEEAASADAQTIHPDAELLFVAGAGWTKKQADGQVHVREAESLILSFLESSRASLGSSKSLVDQSSEGQTVLAFLSHLNQVGQTGSTPRHPKGLAACCHGEEPHVVGWRFIKERRAINTDPNCGWSQGKADVVYVGDAFEVVAKLNALLARQAVTSDAS